VTHRSGSEISSAIRNRAWRLPTGVLAAVLLLAAPAFAQDAGEIEFWKTVQGSKNPAELQAYLDAYPEGRFAPLARLRIATLRGTAAAPTAEPQAPGAPAVARPTAPAASAPEVLSPPPGPVAKNPGAGSAAEANRAAAGRLYAAIRAGDLEAAKAAVAQGVDVNAPDGRGMPPIGLAALHGRAEIIRLLADHGADVNRNDRYGFTPLMDAAIRGQPGAVRALLAAGADPKLKGANGNDPIGAARPNGPADPRFAGKLEAGGVLAAAIAARAGGAAAAAPAEPSGGAGQSTAAVARPPPSVAAVPAPALPRVGIGSLRFTLDQPTIATEAYLQDVAKSVRESTKLSCEAPKFYHWDAGGWDKGRVRRNMLGVLEALDADGYRLKRLKAPFDNMQVVQAENPMPGQPAPSLVLAFYLEANKDYYLMACMANP